jgi:hypothetical protein
MERSSTFKSDVLNKQYALMIRQRFDIDIVAERSAFTDCNAIFGGSTVLQTLIGERWPDSDLDIYVERDRHRISYLLRDRGYQLLRGFAAERKALAEYDWDELPGSHSTIVSVLTYTKQHKQVQLISIVPGSYPRLLDLNDLSICCNSYNLDEWYVRDPNIWDKRGEIIRMRTEKSMQRVHKYEERGFNFRTSVTPSVLIALLEIGQQLVKMEIREAQEQQRIQEEEEQQRIHEAQEQLRIHEAQEQLRIHEAQESLVIEPQIIEAPGGLNRN